MDRLTKRSDEELMLLKDKRLEDLTFNELLAVAGQKLEEKMYVANNGMGNADIIDRSDAMRDGALTHTHLEDALMRYNSLCYRLNESWKRADPEAPKG